MIKNSKLLEAFTASSLAGLKGLMVTMGLTGRTGDRKVSRLTWAWCTAK